jgi:single-strand DNA-binding protein
MGVNKVILLGRLGKDPELRYTSSQLPVVSFSLATGERRKDQSGNWVEHTEWHNITAFNKTAELCSNYLKKGREVYVEGRIQTRKWQDKEGKDRYTTEIIANSVQFIGSRSDNAGYSGGDAGPVSPQFSQEGASDVDTAGSGGTSDIDSGFSDDDIPF